MRKINAKLCLVLLIGCIVGTGAVFGVHHFQYGRIADSLLWQARRAEEQGQVKRQARYLQRYLEFNPKDLEEKAHLAKLWASDTFAGSTRYRQKAVNLLDQVLTYGDDKPELRRLLVKVALEVQQFKMAHNHLEKLLSSEFLKAPVEEPAAVQKRDPERGEAEGYAGQLMKAENQPDKALVCYRLAVKHAPEIQPNYVNLALLLREQKDFTPEKIKECQNEADKIVNDLVENNRLSYKSYLARWHYRRDFGLIDSKKDAADGKVNLKMAAGDVAEALQRAPESVDVLLAAADLERLEGQVVFTTELSAADKEKQRLEHRDKALAYLEQGLKVHAAGGREAAVDMTQYRLLWHKANLLLDDIELLDAARGSAGKSNGTDQRPEWVAEVGQAIEQIRKTSGRPAAADYLKGRLLLQDRRWAEAVTLLEQVRPTLGAQADLASQINRYLGQCYEQLNEPGQQYNALERLQQNEPGSVVALLGMAKAEWSMGHLDKAAEKFRRLEMTQQMPDKVWVEYARLEIQRHAQRQTNNWENVETLLARAAKANPKAVEVPLARAQMEMVRSPNLDEARKVLQTSQAKEVWKDNAELWTARIYLEMRDKKLEKAQEILREAKQKLGEHVVLLRVAEARLLADANSKTAEPAINRLADDAAKFKDEEDQARLLSGLADVQLSLENVKAARELWQRMAKLPSHQTDLSLHLLLFDMAVKVEDEAGMRQTLADIRGVEGNQGPFHRYGEALRLIWQAKKLPNETEDEQMARQKTLDEARGHLDRVQSIRPNWPPLYLARAQIDRMVGQTDQAVANLQEAVNYGETNPAVIHDLVDLLINAGRYPEADVALKRLRDPLQANSDLSRLATVLAVHFKDIKRANALMQVNRTPEDAKDYRQLLWEGRMLAETDNPEEAERKLRAALRMASKEADPYVALVQFFVRQKREKEADAVLKQAREQLPADRVELTLAQCYEILGQKKSAQAQYEEALNGHRKDATTVRRVANFYWDARQLEQAEPLLRDILEKRVKKPSVDDVNWARWHLALVLASGTDYGRFREALTLVGLKLDNNGQLLRDPERERTDSTDTKRFQARVLAAQAGHRQFRQRALEMLEALERSKGLRPDDRFILAMLYESEAAWAKAKPILQQLVEEREPGPRHLAYFVQMLLEHNELEEANRMADRLEALEELRGPDQNAFAATELRARLLELQGKGDAALKRLEDLLRRPKAKPEEVLLVLNSLRRQKRFPEALDRCLKTWEAKKCSPEIIGGASVAVLRSMQSSGKPASHEQVSLIESYLKKSLEANPKSVVLMLHLAELYDQGGKWADAETMYRQVLLPQNEPKNVVALNNLAWLLAQQSTEPQKHQEALVRIESAVNGIGRRADLIDTRGLVYLKLNQDAAALADFRAAAADMPTPAHLFHLARAHYKGRDKTNASKVLKEAQAQGLQASSLHPVEQAEYQRLLDELKVR